MTKKTQLLWRRINQILLIVVFHSLFTNSQAQDRVITTSPNAAEIGRFGVVPVGLFTGAIQNEVPIYELGNSNLKLPVSLQYSSNGFTVDKTASTVGYDWSLNAGGVISRYVKGTQDFPNRIMNDFGSLTNYTDEQRYYWLKDYNPVDMFSFTLPGHSGSFYLDKNGIPTIVKNQDNLSIIFDNSEKFTITTSEGVKYVFADFVPGLTQKFESWYLSSIIHPSGDQINFIYSAVKSALPQILTREVYLSINDKDNLLGGQYSTEQFTGIATADRYLERIDFQGVGSIVFTNSFDRSDSKSDPKIDKITVLDRLGERVRSVKLRYQFPKNNSAYDIKVNYPNSEQYYKYRMFLDGIEFNDKGDNKIYEYGFSYNNLNNLPPRYSYSKDFWGYFNGKPNGDIINLNDFTWLATRFGQVAYSELDNIVKTKRPNSGFCDRSADYNFSKNGMLSKIKYPTGGYSNIYYEAHKNGNNKEVGGCRVERVETFSSNSATPEIKAYKYPKVTINYGDHDAYSTYMLHDFNYTHIEIRSSGEYVTYDATHEIAHWLEISPDLQSNYSTGGYHLCYGEVDIWHGINGENGMEEHEFRAVSPLVSGVIWGTSQVYTPLKYFNNDLFNGIPIRETIKKNNKVQKEIVYNYDFENTKYLKTLVCNNVYYNNTGRKDCGMYLCDHTPAEKLMFFDVARYDIYSNFPYLTSKKETITDDNSQTITTESFYDYCPAPYTNIRSVRVKNSQGKDMTTVYKYPFDNNSQSPYSSMVTSKVTTPVIEQQEYVGSNGQSLLKSVVSTDYSAISQGLYKPVSIYKLENSKLLNANEYTTYATGLITRGDTWGVAAQMKYDSKGNISEIKEKDGMPTTYLWSYSYNNPYPVAKIVGLNYDEVSAIIGSSGIYNLAQNASPTRDDIEAVRTKIKDSGKTALVTTYTYLPPIGMTSVTDTRGVTTNYTYDTFNRLYMVRNNDKNILGQYRYGYQNAPDNGHGGYAAPVTTVTPGATSYLPGTTGTAALGNISGGTGSYTYSWYLKTSTGTVLASNLNTTSTSFSFFCSQPGTLTIQCLITDNVTGLSSTSSTTFISGVVPVYGSFYTVSGYTYPYTSLSKTGSYVTFLLVFLPTSSPMNAGTDYYIGEVSAGFRPSGIRYISYDTGGRTWNITVNPGGSVYCKIVSGTSLPVGSAVAFSSLTYNL